MAAGVLDGVDDPSYLSLRQTLVQERAALDGLGVDPVRVAAGRLDAFSARLNAHPQHADAKESARAPWLQHLLSLFVEVRRSDRARPSSVGQGR